MPVTVKVKVDGGKVRYYTQTENDKQNIEHLKALMQASEGKDLYKVYMTPDELSPAKKILNYYRAIMLPPLFAKMQEEYGIVSIHEADAVLRAAYAKKKFTKKDGNTYEIPVPIEALSFSEQAVFISKVADFALAKYAVKYPNANEIEGANT
jgi:hypothetical protein